MTGLEKLRCMAGEIEGHLGDRLRVVPTMYGFTLEPGRDMYFSIDCNSELDYQAGTCTCTFTGHVCRMRNQISMEDMKDMECALINLNNCLEALDRLDLTFTEQDLQAFRTELLERDAPGQHQGPTMEM